MAREELILSDYLGVISRHKLFILLVTLAGLAATAMLTGREQAMFRSQARIKIQRQINVTQMFDELIVSSGDPLENYLMEISGHAVLRRAVTLLTDTEEPAETEIAALRNAITTERIARTDMIDIFATATSPLEARRRCEAVVDAFIEEHDISIRRNAQDVLRTIESSYATLSGNLRRREAQLLEKLGPLAVAGNRESELAPLRQRRAELELALHRLRLSGNFTDEYPQIVQIKAEMSKIDDVIQEKVALELERQAQMAEYERYRSIIQKTDAFFTPRIEEAKIAASKKGEIVNVIEPARDGSKMGGGRRNKLIAGGILSLMLGLILAFVADHLDTSIRNVLEIERLFKLPVLGIIPHFSLQDTHSAPVKGRALRRLRRIIPFTAFETLSKAFNAAFAAPRHPTAVAVPATTPPDTAISPIELIVPMMPRAPATESFRTLRTNIQLHMRDDNNAMVVTSASPAEGKSTTITNLAVAFAQSGQRTLLVGANMRRPQMYGVFGLERERGLSDILVGDMDWKDAVKDYSDVALGEGGQGLATAPGMDNLFYITCGGRTIHPAEWLSQPILGELVTAWKAAYDIVLVDAPPVLPVPDSVVISMVVQQTVLVYQIGMTPRESVRRAITAIQNTEARLLGIVLNDLKPSRVDDAEFYQYRHYYGRHD